MPGEARFEEDRRRILEMVERGELSAENARQMIEAMGLRYEDEAPTQIPLDPVQAAPRPAPIQGEVLNAPGAAEQTSRQRPAPPPPPEDAQMWRGFWIVPIFAGVALIVLSGLGMYLALGEAMVAFWWLCLSAPLLIGALLIFYGWRSRKLPWLHLRIRKRRGVRLRNIAISFPMPTTMAAWVIRILRIFVPGLEKARLDEILAAVGRSARPENPFYIELLEGDDGEHVKLYIG